MNALESVINNTKVERPNKKLSLSDAIRIGAQYTQYHNGFTDGQTGACALTCAYLAVTAGASTPSA